MNLAEAAAGSTRASGKATEQGPLREGPFTQTVQTPLGRQEPVSTGVWDKAPLPQHPS